MIKNKTIFHNSVKIKYYIYAFTLVELLVTITILAILGTISFMGLQGYSQNSRDAVRVSDLSRMKNVLDIFAVEAGKYPFPTDSVNITYSGGTIWKQGTFGESTFANVEKLDKIPTDPLTNSVYTYSILNNNLEFQIGGIVENTDNSFLNNNVTYAGNNNAKALIIGNYNGFAAKSITGSTCSVLTVPSIIANGIDISTSYEDIVTNERLVFDGYHNLPNSFSKTKFKVNGGFAFSTDNLIVYSGSCSDLENNNLLRLNLLSNLKNAYSGSILQNHTNYSSLNKLNIDINSPNIPSNTLADSLTSVILGKKIKSDFSINDMLGTCNINGIDVNNGDSILTYSENNIDNSESYTCSDVSQVRSCNLGVLTGDENFIYNSCFKGVIDNCTANPSFNYNSHFYNISAINHSEYLTDILSQNVNQNNGTYKYKLNSISCNDGEFISINEDSTPILQSCDFGFIVSGNSCVDQGDVIITGADNLSCPGCSN
ncbi:MAG: type II secretion system protein [Candidatus Gracilibacteria bacterium]|nr:type II secretion system protein [Candidatus Gracilibacteria bacterium]